MTVMLLILSLLLNILAFVAIISLYLRQSRLMETEKNQAKAAEEMEEVISAYLAQMKEENEEFLQKLSVFNRPKEEKVKTAAEKNSQKSTKANSAEKNSQNNIKPKPASEAEVPAAFQARIGKASAYQAAKAYKQNADHVNESKKANPEEDIVLHAQPDQIDDQMSNIEEEPPRDTEPTLLSQALVLRNLGLSNDEIAKKLNKGKTEIQLLLKFHEKQQE